MASHYYHPDTLELLPGGLREARKLGGLPSPTTVLDMIMSPGLIHYFKWQMFLATATTPRSPTWTDDEYFAACEKWSKEHGKAARTTGGNIHDVTRDFHRALLNGGPVPEVPPELREQLSLYVAWFEANIDRVLLVEEAVKGPGYAGRLDLLALLKDGRTGLLDCKSQDNSKRGAFNHYTNWAIQLGAYAGALPKMPDVLISICVSSKQPVALEAYVWPRPPMYYTQLFMGLLDIWKEDNQFFGREGEQALKPV